MRVRLTAAAIPREIDRRLEHRAAQTPDRSPVQLRAARGCGSFNGSALQRQVGRRPASAAFRDRPIVILSGTASSTRCWRWPRCIAVCRTPRSLRVSSFTPIHDAHANFEAMRPGSSSRRHERLSSPGANRPRRSGVVRHWRNPATLRCLRGAAVPRRRARVRRRRHHRQDHTSDRPARRRGDQHPRMLCANQR